MSRSAREHRTLSKAHLCPERSVASVQRAIDEVNEKLKYLQDNIIPPHPYLLSVPTDSPYRFHKAFLNSWHAGTPFSLHEEELQYMSFHSHQNPGEDLLKVVGGWSDADGNLVEEDSQSQTYHPSLSAQTTPVQASTRKKISLKDYKTKDKAAQNQATPRPDSVTEAPEQAMEAESKSQRFRGGGNHKTVPADSRNAGKVERKNEVQGFKEDRSSKPSHRVREPDSPSPRKRRRLSSEDPRSGDEIAKQAHSKAKDKKPLPALLSPTMPASDKRRANRELPSLLSPKLPAALERVLADGQAKRSDQVKSILADALGSTTEKKPADRSVVEAGRNRSDSQLSAKTLPVGIKTSPQVKPLIKVDSRPGTPIQNGFRPSPGPRQRHVIVLKYGKRNRKRVEALLKLTTPRKIPRPLEDQPPRKVQEPADRNTATAIKVERKRPAEISPEKPMKKLKPAAETPERPRTPAIAIKSPAGSVSVRKSDLQSTPRKELKTSAMQRVASTDGVEVRTPPIDRGRTSTPVSSLATGGSPAPVAPSAARDSDRAAWAEINTKYFALGRQLKREAQNLAASTSETDQILSAINHIEALLCFMINLSAQSHSRPNVDPGWGTIMPYFIFVFKASRRHRHLHGLVIQLGAICRQVWHNHNIDRLHRDPLPDESCNSAPTPGSDGNTKTDDSERYKKKYLEFKTQLVQNSRELQSAWLEGSRYLSPYLLEREYPKTWAKRTKDTNRRAFEKIDPSKIDGKFYLPLDPSSNAFEAFRFAISLIEEWTDKESVSWKTKIDL